MSEHAKQREAGTRKILAAMTSQGLSFKTLAGKVGLSPFIVAAAVMGQMALPKDAASRAAAALALPDAEDFLAEIPMRGSLGEAVPTDPTIYRLYEIVQVYGTTLKALIHEEFGDGIMYAINFKLDIARRADPNGDRVVVTLDGKFLPYQWG